MNLIWSPDGQHIAFSGPLSEEHPGYDDIADVWLVNRQGNNLSPVIPRAGAKWLGFNGWIDDNTLVYGGWAGGGHVYDSLLNVFTGEHIASGSIHGQFGHLNGHYVPGTDGMDYQTAASAVVLDYQNPTEYGSLLESGPYIRYLNGLHNGEVEENAPNSHFKDWRFGTTQMLVLTWEAQETLRDYPSQESKPETQLQLWDVSTDELTFLVSDAFYGRLDPTGTTLLFLTAGQLQLNDLNKPVGIDHTDDTIYMHLFNVDSGQIVLSTPTFISVTEFYGGNITHFDTFSPDGHYLTFLAPSIVQVGSVNNRGNSELRQQQTKAENVYLNLFDITTQQVVLSLPSTQLNIYQGDTNAAWWSPTNSQFI